MPHYAVARGKITGVFTTWAECSNQVQGFKGAMFKKFDLESEAAEFVAKHSNGSASSSSSSSAVKRQSKAAESSATTGSDGQPPRKKVKSKPTSSSANVSTSSAANDSGFCDDDVKRLRGDGFVVDTEGFVQVFTDGASQGNGSKHAKAGIGVWFNHGHRCNVSAPISAGGRATNNCAEIEAAVEAVRVARKEGIAKLVVNTDSQFMIDCMTKWMAGWKKKGWKTSLKQDVKNKNELILLDEAIGASPKIDLRWNHVRGHCGIEGNEEADRLATMGAKDYVP